MEGRRLRLRRTKGATQGSYEEADATDDEDGRHEGDHVCHDPQPDRNDPGTRDHGLGAVFGEGVHLVVPLDTATLAGFAGHTLERRAAHASTVSVDGTPCPLDQGSAGHEESRDEEQHDAERRVSSHRTRVDAR